MGSRTFQLKFSVKTLAMPREYITPMELAWFEFTDKAYYHTVRALLIKKGLSEKDTEDILVNLWDSGYIAGFDKKVKKSTD